MSKAITFELNDHQARNFEKLLDDFNETMGRIEKNEPTRQEQMIRLKAESQLLLEQIKEELDGIKRVRSQQEKRKMIWEM